MRSDPRFDWLLSSYDALSRSLWVLYSHMTYDRYLAHI